MQGTESKLKATPIHPQGRNNIVSKHTAVTLYCAYERSLIVSSVKGDDFKKIMMLF